MDDEGALLIVETKADWGRKHEDPLEDFVRYNENPSVGSFQLSAELGSRWRGLFEQEKSFEHDFPSFRNALPLSGMYRGVLPYSRHRKALWQWQHLYEDRIAPRFASGTYERAVKQALQRRASHESPPYFFGVIASSVRDPQLSASGKRAFATLAASAPGRVFVRAIRASERDGQVQIRAWSI